VIRFQELSAANHIPEIKVSQVGVARYPGADIRSGVDPPRCMRMSFILGDKRWIPIHMEEISFFSL